ncbi:unnamed protein product [Cyclocybe aegerita]|uniref:non-specific serine/threonine protein kinase n=1 Tax=Cyclocybe aegerita TaxID=1973307 RepID=A0A8S0VT00_CYCAE|nr:unnamed protein product [Cyclocybe aegerita]
MNPSPVAFHDGGYHLVAPGELYGNRYEVVSHIGRGQNSEVWLVEDRQEQREAALKVLTARATSEIPSGPDEVGMLKILRNKNPDYPGYGNIRHLLDDFVHHGPQWKAYLSYFRADGPQRR